MLPSIRIPRRGCTHREGFSKRDRTLRARARAPPAAGSPTGEELTVVGWYVAACRENWGDGPHAHARAESQHITTKRQIYYSGLNDVHASFRKVSPIRLRLHLVPAEPARRRLTERNTREADRWKTRRAGRHWELISSVMVPHSIVSQWTPRRSRLQHDNSHG